MCHTSKQSPQARHPQMQWFKHALALLEVKMRLVTVLAVLALMSSAVSAEPVSLSIWVLSKDNGQTWCAYKAMNDFTSEVNTLRPTESIRVNYSSGKISDFTYQVEAESGDWIVVDKYTPSPKGMILRRANLLAQQNIQIIEETTILGGKAQPFRIINATTLDGKAKANPSNIDLPAVPVLANISRLPFLQVADEIQRRSVEKLCRTFR